MDAASRRQVVRAVLARYPRTYGEELGIRSLDPPSSLFRLLVMALLMSARIRAPIALEAARAVVDAGWTSPQRMADAGWEARARVLNRAGYARYDERTSTMLGDASSWLIDRYHGDLRRLREEAGREAAGERRLLKQCKGIGDVGVDIFFREAQRSWQELYPFADARALRAADRLGLGRDAAALAAQVSGVDEFARLVSALVRVDLDHAYDALTEAAAPARHRPETLKTRRQRW